MECEKERERDAGGREGGAYRGKKRGSCKMRWGSMSSISSTETAWSIKGMTWDSQKERSHQYTLCLNPFFFPFLLPPFLPSSLPPYLSTCSYLPWARAFSCTLS